MRSTPHRPRRYESYEELYDYCYRVAGTVALMSVPVMGVDKAYKVRGRRAAWVGVERAEGGLPPPDALPG